MNTARIRPLRFFLAIAALLATSGAAHAGLSIGIVYADDDGSAMNIQTKLLDSGLFGSVSLFDAGIATPTLTQLANFDAVLAYTNAVPDDNAALGDVLADFVDSGRGLVLATFAFSDISTLVGNTAISGRIATHTYAPLVVTANVGDLDGMLSATVPGDPIFNGVNLAAPNFYYHDSNFAHPDLDAGATLLATDTSLMSVNLIARSANGRILGMNLFPGSGLTDNSDDFYLLLANSLQNVAPTAVPEPASWMLAVQAGIVGVGLMAVRRVRAKRGQTDDRGTMTEGR